MRNGFAFSAAEIGNVGNKMVDFKRRLETNEGYNALTVLKKG